jgi:arsenate reductase-like glutaredoxin family protein
MKKIYHLASCSTCQRILKEWQVDDTFELQNIKSDPITPAQLDEMIKMAGSVADLFSKKAMKYRAMKLNERVLTDSEMRQLIIDEYTFLKRPVLIIDHAIFIGNSKKVVLEAKEKLSS